MNITIQLSAAQLKERLGLRDGIDGLPGLSQEYIPNCFFKQNDHNSCGLIAIKSILAMYHLSTDVYFDTTEGTTPNKITLELEKRGISTEPKEVSFENLSPRSIAYYAPEDHYVTIQLVSERKVYINNGRKDGPAWLTKAEFEKVWSGWVMETSPLLLNEKFLSSLKSNTEKQIEEKSKNWGGGSSLMVLKDDSIIAHQASKIKFTGAVAVTYSNNGPVVAVGGNESLNETPTGAVNDSNVTYTLAHSPTSQNALKLYMNGVLQIAGVDFTLSGSTVTMTLAPTSGSYLRAFYPYA